MKYKISGMCSFTSHQKPYHWLNQRDAYSGILLNFKWYFFSQNPSLSIAEGILMTSSLSTYDSMKQFFNSLLNWFMYFSRTIWHYLTSFVPFLKVACKALW